MTLWQFPRPQAAAAITTMMLWGPFLNWIEAEPLPAASDAVDVNLLDREIARQMRDDRDLHGAWLFVETAASPDPDTPGKLIFRRVLDRSRAAAQRQKLARLMEAWAPPGSYVVATKNDREYPFSELMAELRLAVETEPKLGGCMISGGYYAPDENEPGNLNLVLQGRIAQEGQDVEIESLCGRIMRAEPAWVKLAGTSSEAGRAAGGADFIPLVVTPKSAQLKVVVPSEANGRWFYGAGLRHFWRADYLAAIDSFREASLESPRKLQYYYWWILSDLANGDESLARRRMSTAVRRFRDSDFDRQSPEYLAVVRSLERVQGPLRRHLLNLETEALLRDSRAGND